MAITSTLPEYTELEKALTSAESTFTPSEVHGYICGILAATGGKLDNSWMKPILGKPKAPTLRELLLSLFESTFHSISEFSFEFTLLLPEDAIDISKRSESLGTWCQGFLTGLGKFNISAKNSKQNDVREALNDIMEIAQINYSEAHTDDEEDESAYFELVEYVRLAVLMIFQELNSEDLPMKSKQ